MPLTYSNKEDFAKKVFGDSLENAIDWIQSNLHPNDVFEVDELKEWVGNNAEPEDVYDEGTLVAWAEKNGFVKSE